MHSGLSRRRQNNMDVGVQPRVAIEGAVRRHGFSDSRRTSSISSPDTQASGESGSVRM